ncbi:hypothetical protein FCV66_13710 [Enterovibrio norvegicus]|nr:hypothetical protein FCV66_13710 [Enterovibrio norvegicus]
MPLAASFAKASSSFLFMRICLSLTLIRVWCDRQLHKISYSLCRLRETYSYFYSKSTPPR